MSLSPKSLLRSSLSIRWLPFMAFCAVIAHYFWFVSSNAINVPHQDDVYDFLQFVQLIEAAEGAEDVFGEWFKQYNDHRTNASRIQVYVAYLVEGEVNFRTHTLLANLALPLILLLFYLAVRNEENRWLFLLVSALVLLHLRTFTVVLWGQPAFAYYYVYFYAFACLFALHKVSVPKFVLAAVLCSLASFTYAAGQIVWALGLASLLHQSLVVRKKSFLYPTMWVLVTVAMLMIWRVGFIAGSLPEVTAANAVQIHKFFPGVLIDPTPQQFLARYAAWFLVILGSAFTDSSMLGAGLAGIFMLTVLLFVSFRFYKSEDIRLVLCCWYSVAAAAAVTVGRAMLQTPDYILDSRYSFLSVMLLTTLALLVQVRFKVFKSSAVYILVVLAGTYSFWTYRHFERPLQDFMSKRYNAFNSDRYLVFGKPASESSAIVREAISTGMYNPPCRPFPECESSSKLDE
jgi:hypothetical protein